MANSDYKHYQHTYIEKANGWHTREVIRMRDGSRVTSITSQDEAESYQDADIDCSLLDAEFENLNDTINRQQAEIERLRAKLKEFQQGIKQAEYDTYIAQLDRTNAWEAIARVVTGLGDFDDEDSWHLALSYMARLNESEAKCSEYKQLAEHAIAWVKLLHPDSELPSEEAHASRAEIEGQEYTYTEYLDTFAPNAKTEICKCGGDGFTVSVSGEILLCSTCKASGQSSASELDKTVCSFCYHSYDDPCKNYPECQDTGNPTLNIAAEDDTVELDRDKLLQAAIDESNQKHRVGNYFFGYQAAGKEWQTERHAMSADGFSLCGKVLKVDTFLPEVCYPKCQKCLRVIRERRDV